MKSFTFTTQRAISRPGLLKGTGIALALPWLDAMHAAFAATPAQPRRFLCVLNYFSFHAPKFSPKEAGASDTPSPYLELLLTQPEPFARCVTDELSSYLTGARVQFADRRSRVASIVAKAKAGFLNK